MNLWERLFGKEETDSAESRVKAAATLPEHPGPSAARPANTPPSASETSPATVILTKSMFKVSLVARNTKDESLIAPPVEVLVDSGSELTWLPRDLLDGIKVVPLRKRSFSTATKQLVTRESGYAIVSAEGFETVDEVVFAEPGDMALLGVRTLEGFGVMVDNIAHRFVATTTIVAVAS
jgi:predicted aspartyl protease